MRTYKVEVDPSARADIEELTSWLQARMTLEGAENIWMPCLTKYYRSLFSPVFTNQASMPTYVAITQKHVEWCPITKSGFIYFILKRKRLL